MIDDRSTRVTAALVWGIHPRHFIPHRERPGMVSYLAGGLVQEPRRGFAEPRLTPPFLDHPD